MVEKWSMAYMDHIFKLECVYYLNVDIFPDPCLATGSTAAVNTGEHGGF